MRKLELDVEALQVESFAPDPRDAATAGTVEGYAGSFAWNETCQTARTGRPDCTYCQVSGAATCVLCPGDTTTCQDCSYTGGEAVCYW